MYFGVTIVKYNIYIFFSPNLRYFCLNVFQTYNLSKTLKSKTTINIWIWSCWRKIKKKGGSDSTARSGPKFQLLVRKSKVQSKGEKLYKKYSQCIQISCRERERERENRPKVLWTISVYQKKKDKKWIIDFFMDSQYLWTSHSSPN